MSTSSKPSSGWNRSGSTPKPPPKKPSAMRGIVAGLVVVVLALAGAWYFLGNDTTSNATKDKKSNRIKEVKSETAAVAQDAADKPARVQKDANLRRTVGESNVDSEAQPQQDNQPKEVKEKKPDNGVRGTDQLLGMAMSLSSGNSVPPMPISASATKDFKESLKTPIVINDSDSDEVKATKQMLMDLREQLRERVENGEKVENILREHQDIANDNNKIRNDIVRELKRIREEGDEEGARKYLNTMNIAIQQMGIDEIEMPLTDAEQKELDEQEQ